MDIYGNMHTFISKYLHRAYLATLNKGLVGHRNTVPVLAILTVVQDQQRGLLLGLGVF